MQMVLDSISGIDRKVLKRLLSDAGGSLSLAELQKKTSKIITTEKPPSHAILKACDFINREISVKLKIGSEKIANLPFTNRLPERTIFIAVQSEHPAICEVLNPLVKSPQRLEPFDACKIRLKFKANFSSALHAHCDLLIRDVPTGRLVERIRFDILIE